MISDEFLSMLACPLGKAPLRQEDQRLVCTRCGLRFQIQDDILKMIVEEAELPPNCHSLADLDCVKSGDATLD